MKKQQEILLNPEEIQQLLEGGLYWKDIQPKLSPENSDNFKRHLTIDEGIDIHEIKLSASVPKENEEEKDIRAILLGEEKPIPHAAASEENAKMEEDLIKGRLFSYASNDATEVELEQKDSLSDINSEPKDSVLNTNRVIFKDNEFKEIILNEAAEEEEERERERTPFGGLKLIILLAVVAACTFGFWYYFLTK